MCFAAQGLFYVADVVEEHGQLAKKVLKIVLYSEIVLHILLMFDNDTSTLQAFVGLLAHLLYLALLPQFPFVDVRSSIAIASAAAAIINHFSWFFHVLLSDNYVYSYTEIADIFTILVWLCPLAFIVSLSSTEPLPISNSSLSTGMDSDDALNSGRTRKGHSLFAVCFNFLKQKSNSLLPTRLTDSSSSSFNMEMTENQNTEGFRRGVQPVDGDVDSSKYM